MTEAITGSGTSRMEWPEVAGSQKPDLTKFWRPQPRPGEDPVRIRILSQPIQFTRHFSLPRSPDGRRDAQEIDARRFAFTVVDRSDGRPKVMEVGRSVAEQISNAVRNGMDLAGQDMVVARDDGRGRFPQFSVVPVDPSPLSEEESAAAHGFVGGNELAAMLESGGINEVFRTVGARFGHDRPLVRTQEVPCTGCSCPICEAIADAGKSPEQRMAESVDEAAARIMSQGWTDLDLMPAQGMFA